MLSYSELVDAMPFTLDTINLPMLGDVVKGKVRDIYPLDDLRILIVSDRVSAFDRILGLIPYKGQVLNQLSLWWFEQTQHIIENHIVESPDVNVSVVRKARVLPVEVVVRGYITGITGTALWTLYEQGNRQPYGISLPEGLNKNDPLPQPIVTPTTKALYGGHDKRLTRDDLLSRGLVEEGLWNQIEHTALALFEHGQRVAQSAGLILVDTKYEFGLIDERLVLIDEIHTPDSSRYWIEDSYKQGNPEHFDKEYLRLWFAENGYAGEGLPPRMPEDFIARVAGRYISAYERLTGLEFVPGQLPISTRIERNLAQYTIQGK